VIPELAAALVIASAAVEVEDDAALVGRLQSGDETAFVELVRRYQPRLLRLAESTVGRGAVAQEVTQDTWLAVFRGVDRFEGRSSFKTWLFRILLNRARSAARREERAGRPDDALSDERCDANGAWADPPEPWSDRAEDRLVASQLADRVRDLLPQIPEAQRQVVVLCDMEGMPPADVVSMLGLTEGNRRVLLHRGRARLRALLAEEMTRS
jgi:RNA polymerase sigma-70 factor, ECF subfamily